VPNFFVAARRRERKKKVPLLSLLLFQSCKEYDLSNRFYELENLAEFYIFILDTAPGGDEYIWAIKLYSGRLQIQK
jgi:hypothetical protein